MTIILLLNLWWANFDLLAKEDTALSTTPNHFIDYIDSINVGKKSGS